jgi:hypothetical protein
MIDAAVLIRLQIANSRKSEIVVHRYLWIACSFEEAPGN